MLISSRVNTGTQRERVLVCIIVFVIDHNSNNKKSIIIATYGKLNDNDYCYYH